MRVNLAKAVFDQGTTDEMIFHIGGCLAILSDLTSSGCGGEEVQWRALTSRRIEVLKKKLAESKETSDGNKFSELQEDLAEVEHNFHVGTIFVECFLNGQVAVAILPPAEDGNEGEVRASGSTDRLRSLYKAMASYSIPSNFSYYNVYVT